MSFKAGEKVAVLDGEEKGVVVKINGSQITIKDLDGFELIFEDSELVSQQLVSEALSSFITDKQKSEFVKDELYASKRKQPSNKKVLREPPTLVVDLHIEKLLKNFSRMSNSEIIDYQLFHARNCLEKARSRGTKRMVFIHGVGQGVLREELYYFLRGVKRSRFYSADFNLYGEGATEIEFF